MRGQNVTADLQDLAALVGGSWPYETAAGVLERLSGVQLSEERLRQLTNEQGTALAKRQHSEAQRGLKEAIDMSEIRAQREHSQDTRLPNSVEWLQVGRMGVAAFARATRGDGRQDGSRGRSNRARRQTGTPSAHETPLRGDVWQHPIVGGTYLWRAGDQDGNVLAILVQSRRHTKAAKSFFKPLLKGLPYVPGVIIPDQLKSYAAVKREILPGVPHRQHKRRGHPS